MTRSHDRRWVLVGILVLLFGMSMSMSGVAGQTLADDRAALMSFKTGVSDPGTALVNWGSGSDPCAAATPWRGVGCNSAGRVVSVSLRSSKLSGEGATSLTYLTNLTALTDLDVSFNAFTGVVPDVCRGGNAKCAATIARVILSGNMLNGVLPGNFAGCDALKHYDVANNFITGTIPQLGTTAQPLRALEFLSLTFNTISGTIPSSLSVISTLKTLRLGGCKLQGEENRTI